MSNKTIGIDLGTTKYCVAVLEGRKPLIIEMKPSYIAYTDDDQILVGEAAKRQAITNPEQTLYAVKRLIGKKFKDKLVQQDLENLPYKIVEADNGEACLEVKRKKIAPPEIFALLLMEMKKNAEDYLGEIVTDAVITVPAYFNEFQRQATIHAGRIAGLEIKRIIDDSAATALAYGIDKQEDVKIAVYDLGGGTFDISIIELAYVNYDNQFEVLSTNGDTLGGEDFDRRIIDYLIKEFKTETDIDLKNYPLTLPRLKEAAEKAKIELSSSQQTEIDLPYLIVDTSEPKHLKIKLSRSKLEALIEDLVERTIELCRITLENDHLSASDIDEVILVGGQTRTPKVKEAIEKLFGKKPRSIGSELVACGAAIDGSVLNGEIQDILLLNVTPMSLGIETSEGKMIKIIEKNTTIPTYGQEKFSTAYDNQTTIAVHVLQGECEMASANNSLGRFDLIDIPPAPRGTPRIEVKFSIDGSDVLEVFAKDEATGNKQSITINYESLSVHTQNSSEPSNQSQTTNNNYPAPVEELRAKEESFYSEAEQVPLDRGFGEIFDMILTDNSKFILLMFVVFGIIVIYLSIGLHQLRLHSAVLFSLTGITILLCLYNKCQSPKKILLSLLLIILFITFGFLFLFILAFLLQAIFI